MNVKHVSLAVDDHPEYKEFWHVVYPIWKMVGLQPHLAYTGASDEVYEDLQKTGGDFITRLEGGIKEAWAASWGIFYGLNQLPEDEVAITCGIDQLPLGRGMTDLLAGCGEGYAVLIDKKGINIPTAYHAAKVSEFQAVMEFEDTWEEETRKLDEFPNPYLEYAARGRPKWGLDETWATLKLSGHDLIKPISLAKFMARRLHTRGGILGRREHFSEEALRDGWYYELICGRPYSVSKGEIDAIIDIAFAPI